MCVTEAPGPCTSFVPLKLESTFTLVGASDTTWRPVYLHQAKADGTAADSPLVGAVILDNVRGRLGNS